MYKKKKYRFTPQYLKTEYQWINLISILSEINSHFNCSRCGKCCEASPPLLFSDEYKSFGKDMTVWESNNIVCLKAPCLFFDKQSIFCRINDNKPRACKAVPFGVFYDEYLCIMDCNLGEDIMKSYNQFLNETGRTQYIGDYTGEERMNVIFSSFMPFDDNPENVIGFLKWLRKNDCGQLQ